MCNRLREDPASSGAAAQVCQGVFCLWVSVRGEGQALWVGVLGDGKQQPEKQCLGKRTGQGKKGGWTLAYLAFESYFKRDRVPENGVFEVLERSLNLFHFWRLPGLKKKKY